MTVGGGRGYRSPSLAGVFLPVQPQQSPPTPKLMFCSCLRFCGDKEVANYLSSTGASPEKYKERLRLFAPEIIFHREIIIKTVEFELQKTLDITKFNLKKPI